MMRGWGVNRKKCNADWRWG